jgi:hypothetical protein
LFATITASARATAGVKKIPIEISRMEPIGALCGYYDVASDVSVI